MTNRTPEEIARGLTELAERCEKASGPDPELDEAVYDALTTIGSAGPFVWHEFLGKPRSADRPPPRFTASLDAAMTLKPEGWYIGEWVESPDRDTSWVTLVPAADERVERAGKADTGPLALTAACLRALAVRSHLESHKP